MATIKNVALAGATGNLGPAILSQLLAHHFAVTVLTRPSSTHTFPPSVKVHPVDYSSPSSLLSALHGQDAVISTLAPMALPNQLLLIDAAVTAGVNRFIPSEFGSDTSNPKTAALPIYANKIVAQKVLREKAGQRGMSYTIICNGPFLDWGITKGFMSLKEKRITLYDGGETVFSTTTLPTIGKAVCAVLTHLDITANRVVKIQDTATTQNRLFEMGKKAVGEEGWKVEDVSVDDVLGRAWEGWGEGKRDLGTMYGFLPAANWGTGYGGRFERVDNGVLGLGEMGEEEVRGVVDWCATA